MLHADPEILGAGSSPPVTRPAAGHAHAVHFWEDGGALCRRVAEFMAEGLVGGEAAVLIATSEHRLAVIERLEEAGVDAPRLQVAGQLQLLDAAATLALFMADGTVDVARFREVVGAVLRHGVRASRAGSVRAYGEMVDLLWSEGREEAALRVEELWDELGEEHPLRLLCGYSLEGFAHAGDDAAFRSVCDAHGGVLHHDAYLSLDEDGRAREMSRLRQRERALETELRHRRLLEARLRAALAGAEAASQAKSEFVAMMSHELRTPLNAIAGYVALIEMGIRGPVTESQRADLHRIRESQHHLLGLIDQVLDHAKLEAGTLDFRLEEVPAADALLAAHDVVAPQALQKGVALRVETRTLARPAVVADPDRLRRILINLLANAVKFTPPGGWVRVECETEGGEVLFRVTDTGIGIAPEQLERIFDPFVQVESDLARVHDGTGLGLSISRALARGMGGEVTVESAPGSGSTFTVRLPRAGGAG